MSIHSVTAAAPIAGPALTVEPIARPRDRMRFIQLPWQVYASNACWVPPLLIERRRFFDPTRNPFFKHAEVQLFIARRGTRDVGTIAAFVNRTYNQFQGTQIGFFGFFEVLMDAEAAAALLQTAEAWVRERGMSAIRGPINFATDNESGLLLDAFDAPPVIMTAYNPPYYRAFIEAAGFVKALDWYAYTIDRATLGGGDPRNLPPKLLRALSIARRRSDATFRTVRMHQFDAELARVQQVYNQAWERNPDFVPLDDAEIHSMAGGLKPFIDPDLVWIAEDGDQVVGVAITLPDLNQVLRTMNGRLWPFGWWHLRVGRAHIDTARVFALGIIPEYRQRGIDAVLYYETFCAAIRKGYQRAELSLVVEDNMAMRRTIEALGARIYKTYRVYEKLL
jgi:GNAT superfamily N-acetyltransferase